MSYAVMVSSQALKGVVVSTRNGQQIVTNVFNTGFTGASLRYSTYGRAANLANALQTAVNARNGVAANNGFALSSQTAVSIHSFSGPGDFVSSQSDLAAARYTVQAAALPVFSGVDSSGNNTFTDWGSLPDLGAYQYPPIVNQALMLGGCFIGVAAVLSVGAILAPSLFLLPGVLGIAPVVLSGTCILVSGVGQNSHAASQDLQANSTPITHAPFIVGNPIDPITPSSTGDITMNAPAYIPDNQGSDMYQAAGPLPRIGDIDPSSFF